MKTICTACLLALGLTACDGGNTTTGPPAGAAAPTIERLAEQLGCTPERDAGPAELYTKDAATCAGMHLTVFADNANRDAWYEVARTYGGNFVVGDRWAVTVDTPLEAADIAATTGGQIK